MPPAPPPDGLVGIRAWSPATHGSAPEGTDGGSDARFHLYCGFLGDACNGFRASFHWSYSQISVLSTARRLMQQQTYLHSACPYECDRQIVRHAVHANNRDNLLAGAGLQGERFLYAGRSDDAARGFSRFERASGERGVELLHQLHMARNVSLDDCHGLVEAYRLIAPHAVWMVMKEYEDATTGTERRGECGLYLAARSEPDAQLWRASYAYARFAMRLGHFDTYTDDAIRAAAVHSSPEGQCLSGTSSVCIFWSEFAFDDTGAEYSCRPDKYGGNVVTPAQLLAQLEATGIMYPPPSPPPPRPPEPPPNPSPPPNAIRCELGAVATTQFRKIPVLDDNGYQFKFGDKPCWRWDQSNDWPPV